MNTFFRELLQVGLYKRTQGRITRQVTLAAIAILVGFGFYRFSELPSVRAWHPAFSMGIPFVLTLICWWMAYRLVNVPKFADFLIAVEAEMNKVSWPTRTELVRSSLVVLVCILLLAVVLTVYDTVWVWLFKFIGIFS